MQAVGNCMINPTIPNHMLQGMDGRVVNPTKKGKENAFVIALGGMLWDPLAYAAFNSNLRLLACVSW